METSHLLDIRDIAVMKIIVISQRGRKRDFVDLYWYAQHVEPLGAVLERLPDQYPTVAHDYHHILKSLIYFADAEEDPMP
ncbi:MAG: nucleotidyl transferase AbiEii/AbiGii toxin family protein, partial [Parcubacteria group bacterium]|nr:nucleotidyl transferase AbiEii/AbiGii toxin family protein [Parcubacteria group bacterium]